MTRAALAMILAISGAGALGACAKETTPRPNVATSEPQQTTSTAVPADATAQPSVGPARPPPAQQPPSTSMPGPMRGMGGMGRMGGMGMMQGSDCPMAVANTTVQTASTADGMDMTYTTSGDVAELRRRVRAMAEHMNARSSAAGAAGGPGMMRGMDMMGMPPVRAQVEDVAGGARMHVTPLDASRLGEMRQHLEQRAQMMRQQHACPMGPAPGATSPGQTPPE